MTPTMCNADVLDRNARRLGARPIPLAYGEVAEFTARRRPNWPLIAALAFCAAFWLGLYFGGPVVLKRFDQQFYDVASTPL